jgi:hypothetical protein
MKRALLSATPSSLELLLLPHNLEVSCIYAVHATLSIASETASLRPHTVLYIL